MSASTNRVLVLVAALATLTVGVIVGGQALAGPGTPTEDALGPREVTVELTIHHSRFSPDHLRVHSGTTVRFVVHNDDPIGHELIVGDGGVHHRHEAGTEPSHPPRPGEVSVAPGQTVETTFTFEGTTGSGSVLYACHLPGHFRYGMSGTVEVIRT